MSRKNLKIKGKSRANRRAGFSFGRKIRQRIASRRAKFSLRGAAKLLASKRRQGGINRRRQRRKKFPGGVR